MNLIVAVDENWGIGRKGGRLFNLKGDMKFFKEQTTDKVVVAGRKTLLTFSKEGRLKRRINVCLTSDPDFTKEGVVAVNSLKELFEKLSFYKSDNIFVAGGEQIYKQLLPFCNFAFVTKIQARKDADKFLPNLDNLSNWELCETSDPLMENKTVFYFCKYKNITPQKFNYGYEEEVNF